MRLYMWGVVNSCDPLSPGRNHSSQAGQERSILDMGEGECRHVSLEPRALSRLLSTPSPWRRAGPQGSALGRNPAAAIAEDARSASHPSAPLLSLPGFPGDSLKCPLCLFAVRVSVPWSLAGNPSYLMPLCPCGFWAGSNLLDASCCRE